MKFFRMSKIVLHNLFHKPATLMYPVKPRAYFTNTRGSIDIEISDCIFCSLCQRKCPTGAIQVVKADKLWEIDRLKCIQCGACVDACSVKKCLKMNNQYSAPVVEKSKDAFNA